MCNLKFMNFRLEFIVPTFFVKFPISMSWNFIEMGNIIPDHTGGTTG
jgi:hypothetical protein